MSQTFKVGPADHGRRMSLADFEDAEAKEGYRYELARGVVVVTDIPDTSHLAVVFQLKRQLYAYRQPHREVIAMITSASESKILIDDYESERHPDISVYKTRPPKDGDVWRIWVPELVIEVVSPTTARCDYEEKPEEYLRVGVAEYWVVDPTRGEGGEVLVLTRSGAGWQHRVVRRGERLSTFVLPGFELDTATVFGGDD